MVKPLDVYLGQELAPEREAAIAAVKTTLDDDNSHEFWDRVRRVQDICEKWDVEPRHAASAVALVSGFLTPDGEYGHMVVSDGDINPLVAAIAHRFGS